MDDCGREGGLRITVVVGGEGWMDDCGRDGGVRMTVVGDGEGWMTVVKRRGGEGEDDSGGKWGGEWRK